MAAETAYDAKKTAPPLPKASPWAPFRERGFTVLWIATVVSNTGTWMHDVGAGWLMTELSPSPVVVSMVQASTTLPVFLFALVAGALADILDRRKMLLIVNILMAIAALLLTILVVVDAVTPALLLAFTFAFGTGAAFLAPAWQAIVPKLVPREALASAVSLNSMGINVSRAIGPAVAGVLIVSVGLASPFLVNVVCTLAIIAALLWWRPAPAPKQTLPPEHVLGAIRSGVKYALNSSPLKQTIVRAVGFFLFASAYWAMLPLIARDVLDGGASLYGVLLGCVGGGAVVGALVMPTIRARLGADWTVRCGAGVTALVLLLFAFAPNGFVASIASALGGVAWIAVLSSLNVSAQTALPDWVRARGLSIFLMAFSGSMAVGSLIWGQIALMTDVPTALFIAAVGALLAVLLTWRARLGQGEKLDFTPSMHWPQPVLERSDPDEHRAVTVQIAYQIEGTDHNTFKELMLSLRDTRRRMGGYGWILMQDATNSERFVETWHETSWTQHLRHHAHVTVSDQALQESIHKLHKGDEAPKPEHFLASEGPAPGGGDD